MSLGLRVRSSCGGKKIAGKDKFRGFIQGWIESNIFQFRIGDALAYQMLYLAMPVIVTRASLLTLPKETHAAAYCYFSIVVSAANCIYDAASRMDHGTKCVKNTKLWLIIASNCVALLYGLFQFVVISQGSTLAYRNDGVLLWYMITIIIAIVDFLAIVVQDTALIDAIKD